MMLFAASDVAMLLLVLLLTFVWCRLLLVICLWCCCFLLFKLWCCLLLLLWCCCLLLMILLWCWYLRCSGCFIVVAVVIFVCLFYISRCSGVVLSADTKSLLSFFASSSSSNWVLMSCQPHRVTSGQPFLQVLVNKCEKHHNTSMSAMIVWMTAITSGRNLRLTASNQVT